MAESVYGHSIPYELTDSEVQSFLEGHPEISARIVQSAPNQWTAIDLPPYGIIVDEAYGQFLVWIDATFHLHIIDVTNLSIATEVQKAPYQSEDDTGFWENLFNQLESTANTAAAGAMNLVSMLALFGVALLVFMYVPRAR